MIYTSQGDRELNIDSSITIASEILIAWTPTNFSFKFEKKNVINFGRISQQRTQAGNFLTKLICDFYTYSPL